MTEQEKYMKAAMTQAKKAYALGEVPIGCVIVHEGKIIGRGYNRRNTDKNTLAHAEITAINKASRKIGDWRLEDCTLYGDTGAVSDVLRRYRTGPDSRGRDRLYESQGGLRRIYIEYSGKRFV